MEQKTTGIELIVQEREQQIKRGYDDKNEANNLIRAIMSCLSVSHPWPWANRTGPMQKGYSYIHCLKVAGALCAAAIDVHLREQPEAVTEGPVKFL